MYILKPVENDFLSAINIINLYRKLAVIKVKQFDLDVVEEKDLQFDICIKWSCLDVFHAFVMRFNDSVRSKIYNTLLRLYWNLYGQVSLDIPVYYRIEYNVVIDQFYEKLEEQNLVNASKYAIRPFVPINYSSKHSKQSVDLYDHLLFINHFWVSVALYNVKYFDKQPKKWPKKIKINDFPIIDWLGVNTKMVDSSHIKLVKKLVFGKNIKFTDIMDKNQVDDPKYVTNMLWKLFLFDACVYNKDNKDNNNHTIVGSVNIERIVTETKNTKAFKGFYKHKNDIYEVEGSRSSVISKQKDKNYIPHALFEQIPYIKKNYQINSPEKLLLQSPIPNSPEFIMERLADYEQIHGILIQKLSVYDANKSEESDLILLNELSVLYPRLFSCVLSLDSKTKRNWEINYISQYDMDFMLKFILSFSSINEKNLLNNISTKRNIMRNYMGLAKSLTQQNKKLTGFGQNVGGLSFFSNIYKFGYTRKFQKSDYQPKFSHPYSMWLQVYDPKFPTIYKTIDMEFLDNLLKFTQLHSHMINIPFQIKKLHPWFYDKIRLLEKSIKSEDFETMYIDIFRIYKEAKTIKLNIFNRKLYWICNCLLYKKYSEWHIGDELFSTHYEQAYSMNYVVDYIFSRLHKDGLVNKSNIWDKEFGVDTENVDEYEINPLTVFPLNGQGTMHKMSVKTKIDTESNTKIIGMQIPIVPILLPNINPIKTTSIPKNFNTYDLMLNTLGNIRFPVVGKEYKNSNKYKNLTSIYIPPNIKFSETSYKDRYNIVISVGKEPIRPPIDDLKLINKTQVSRESRAGSITSVIVDKITLYNFHIIREPDYIFTQLIHILNDTHYKFIYTNHPFADDTLKKIKKYILNNMDKNTLLYRGLPIGFKYILELDIVDHNFTKMYLYYAYMIRFKDSFNFTKDFFFVDQTNGYPIMNPLKRIDYSTDIDVAARRYKNIFEKYNIPVETYGNIYNIQRNFYTNINKIEIKEFYNFLIKRNIKYVNGKFVSSWFTQVKEFNIFNHIRYLEYVTKTTIILLYNRDKEFFVFNRDNWYFNPRYKKISFMFVLSRLKDDSFNSRKIYTKSLNNQQLMLYRNENNSSSWANRDWYITPVMLSANYIPIDQYLKENDFNTYDQLVDIVKRNDMLSSFKGKSSVSQYLESVVKSTKIKTKINRIKPSADFSITKTGKKVTYTVDIDPRDPIYKIIQTTVEKFQVADDTPKDVGLLNRDGFIKSWIINNKLYVGDGFSTHESCKRIIREEIMRKIVGEDRYIIYNTNTRKRVDKFKQRFGSINFKTQRFDSRLMLNVESKPVFDRVISMLNINVDDQDDIEMNEPFLINIPKIV